MNTDEYKLLIKSKDVLDYRTLKVTIDELERLDNKRLIEEVKRIITDNKIEKPTLHNQKDEQTTDYYKIDLSLDDIEYIVSMFGNREVASLGPDYESTTAASLYATLLDNWNRIILD
jgi:hypothetical protein